MNERTAVPTDAMVRHVRYGVLRLGRRLRAERPAAALPTAKLAILADLQLAEAQFGGGVTPGTLARVQRAKPQSLTRVVEELVEDGLVEKIRDPQDGRQVILTITASGRETIQADMAPRDAWLARVMAERLTPAEQRLIALAGELLARLGEPDWGE